MYKSLQSLLLLDNESVVLDCPERFESVFWRVRLATPSIRKTTRELPPQRRSPRRTRETLAIRDSYCICSPYESFACRASLMRVGLVSCACGSISSGWQSRRSSADLLLRLPLRVIDRVPHSVYACVRVHYCVYVCTHTRKILCTSLMVL